ncbi:hypothetical protein HY837_02690 [archaeon]|nr:hypothetical protein [archaeon]
MILESYQHSKFCVVTGIASLFVGVYHGYNNSKGIPVNHEFALTVGPAAVQGAMGGIFGLLLSSGLGGASLSVGMEFGSIGAAKGGLETLAGYMIGYVGGKFF